jgi:hypothetical protein
METRVDTRGTRARLSKKSDSDFYGRAPRFARALRLERILSQKKPPRIDCSARGGRSFEDLPVEDYWSVPFWQSICVVDVAPGHAPDCVPRLARDGDHAYAARIVLHITNA